MSGPTALSIVAALAVAWSLRAAAAADKPFAWSNPLPLRYAEGRVRATESLGR